MRVLQLVSDTDRRGAQVFAAQLEAALSHRGHHVRTCALVRGDQADSLPISTLAPSGHWSRTVRPLRRMARGNDVVIAHGSTTLPAAALAVGGRVPFIYRSIGDLSHWAAGPVRRRWVRWALGRADRVAVLWPEAARFVTDNLAVAPGRVVVIPNAVPAALNPRRGQDDRRAARRELGIDEQASVVAYVGSLTVEKRVDRLIAAVAALGPPTVLVIAGDGPRRAALSRQATGIDVRFLGQVADPGTAYAAADVVALTSETEGQPGVLLEAAMAGRPVVAPSLAGISHLVSDGHTGVLFDPHADTAAVADALRRAAIDADRLGRAATRWALDRFEMEAVADLWHEAIATVAVH